MESHQSLVLPPSSSGIELYAAQDVRSAATAGKQVMKVEKFVQEVQELYVAKSKLVRCKTGDTMSPQVIIKRLSAKAIKQHTRRHRNRLRSNSLSETDDSSASSDGTHEDEADGAVRKTSNVQTLDLHRRLPEGQAKDKIQEEFNKENVADPSQRSTFTMSFGKDVLPSDDDEDDVLDSDYSGDLPDLTDPSWESPAKLGNRKKSQSKKSHKKKHKRDEEYFKKRKDPKLWKSAKKAFEHQKKIFISSKKYEKKLKDAKDSKSSRVSNHKTGSPELGRSGVLHGSWGPTVSNQSPNPVTVGNQDTKALPVRLSIVQGVSVTPSASDSAATNSRKEKIRMLVKANMGKSLMKPLSLLVEEYSDAQAQHQVIASTKHLSREGMPLTQIISQPASGLLASSPSNLEAHSTVVPLHKGTTDMTKAEEAIDAYDSDETVTFEETHATLSNVETSSNGVLVNDNNNIVKRVSYDASVIDCAMDSKKRKRQGSESVDESCGEENKRIKQEKSEKSQATEVQGTMVIVPSTTMETLVSATPVSVSANMNVPTATSDHIPLKDQTSGSLEVTDKVSDVHAPRRTHEEEKQTQIGKQIRKEGMPTPLEGSALMLKSYIGCRVASHEKRKDGRELPLAPPAEVECAASGETNRNSDSVVKGSPNKPIKSIKEFSSILKELSNKRTHCEEKIKKIKEECDKKIEMLETEKREYEKEMEKMVSLMQNWREPSPDESETDASHGPASRNTVQDLLTAGTSHLLTADSTQNTSSESASQKPSSSASQGPLLGSTSEGSLTDLASPDTGMVELQQSKNKISLSCDVSSHKFTQGTPATAITATNLGKSTTEKLSGTGKQQNLTINVISAANINRFGNASTTSAKGSKKSRSKSKVVEAAAVSTSQTVPVSNTPPTQQVEELMNQTSRGSSHGTSTAVSSGAMLLPKSLPTTQVQSSPSLLWPPVSGTGSQICPNVVVTNLMHNVQQQPARLQLIQPVPTLYPPPPPYPEHLKTLRAVQPSLNQYYSVVQQGTLNGMPTISSVQPGSQVQQIQTQSPQLDQQHQIVSVQQQPSLQQPHQQVQHLTIQPQTQHASSHQLTQSSQQPQLQQLMQQHHQQQLLQQQHRTSKQGAVVSVGSVIQVKTPSTNEGIVTPGCNLYAPAKKITQTEQGDVHTTISQSGSKGSKTGHQSHLLVSATPAPTLGGAIARSAHPAQPPPCVVSKSVCGSNSGTEPLRTLQPTMPVTAPVNAPSMTVLEIPGQPTTTRLNASQESPIDFSGGGRSKVVASTTNLAILSQSCFLCGEKGEILCCNSIVYCGPSCQVKDWSRHEPECSHKNS
ncbi:uncharacterized protein [Panulirus ornatus]|uniref:uncharacterized protein isoform X2 n=1 Tax=Panulirus ornatus TaxID=150431 RepID=UPI003A8352A9